MVFIKQRICPMTKGIERKLYSFFLMQTKKVRGFTKFLDQKAGINAKWTKVDEAFNISSETLIKIVINKALFQTRGEFKADVDDFVDYLYDEIIPTYSQDKKNNKKQKE